MSSTTPLEMHCAPYKRASNPLLEYLLQKRWKKRKQHWTKRKRNLTSRWSTHTRINLLSTRRSTVLVRSIDVGEVIQAGMPAMTIGKLDTLKVTVYIPEDQYRKISLSEKAALNLDSFPNENFTATVTRISEKAEFPLQNEQTKEGRQITMYAVKLSIDNSNQKLKHGISVDVTFGNQLASK